MNRFIHNSRKCSASRQTGPLTVLELTRTKVQWLHHVQHSTFTDEIDNLMSKRCRLPLVRQLRLFLDHDGLLRCGGRIHNAPLSELAKFPIYYRLATSSQHWSSKMLMLHSCIVESMQLSLQSVKRIGSHQPAKESTVLSRSVLHA